MATITTLVSPTVTTNMSPVQTSNLKTPYVVWYDIDLAAAATAKGSALAAGDIIEAVRVPAKHVILDVWTEKLTALQGGATVLTVDVGVTGTAPNRWVAAWDLVAAANESYGTPQGVGQSLVNPVSDTIDILLKTQTGTVSGGKIRVFACIASLQVRDRGSIAQLKS